MILVIVESPTKCSKIEKILGSGYKCIASQGHLCDIPENIKWFNPESPDIPFRILPNKKKIVENIKKYAKSADEVYIATDLDREGEAIGFHIMDLLKMDYKKTKRLLFDEITEEAIKNAVKNPVTPRLDLYHAQLSRRIVDILFGFMISPLLWNVVAMGLSAGRCQSPCLALIKEKEDQYANDVITKKMVGKSKMKIKGKNIDTTLVNPIQGSDIADLLKSLQKVKHWFIQGKESKDELKYPPKPFTTSSLQQKCYHLWKWNPKKTMLVAQKLYENGYVTYIRTDSRNMSSKFISEGRKYITSSYGAEHVEQSPKESKKIMNSQEAHECIRPTNVTTIDVKELDNDCIKMYKLVHKVSVGYLMKPAIENKITYQIGSESVKAIEWRYTESVVTYPGFLLLENVQAEGKLSGYEIGEKLQPLTYSFYEECDMKERPYNTSDVIKMLEKRGIGRPSTYSSIITKLEDRNYVETDKWKPVEVDVRVWDVSVNDNFQVKETVKKQEINQDIARCYKVTDVGSSVNDWMKENFKEFLDEKFTQDLESDLDKIANGELDYWKLIKEFYFKIKKSLPKRTKKKEKETTILKEDGIEKIGFMHTKKGPAFFRQDVKQKKTYYADTNGMDLTLDNALKVLNSNILGKYEDAPIMLKSGRFGKYIEWKDKTISVKEEDTHNLETIVDKIKAKETEYKRVLSEAVSIRRGNNGKYYIMYKKGKQKPYFVSLKDTDDPDKLTLETVFEIIKLNKNLK
jgi:DNA topoisomerase-1